MLNFQQCFGRGIFIDLGRKKRLTPASINVTGMFYSLCLNLPCLDLLVYSHVRGIGNVN